MNKYETKRAFGLFQCANNAGDLQIMYMPKADGGLRDPVQGQRGNCMFVCIAREETEARGHALRVW
jgi:hypothetical protein